MPRRPGFGVAEPHDIEAFGPVNTVMPYASVEDAVLAVRAVKAVVTMAVAGTALVLTLGGATASPADAERWQMSPGFAVQFLQPSAELKETITQILRSVAAMHPGTGIASRLQKIAANARGCLEAEAGDLPVRVVRRHHVDVALHAGEVGGLLEMVAGLAAIALDVAHQAEVEGRQAETRRIGWDVVGALGLRIGDRRSVRVGRSGRHRPTPPLETPASRTLRTPRDRTREGPSSVQVPEQAWLVGSL